MKRKNRRNGKTAQTIESRDMPLYSRKTFGFR
jgi:hypothetical protein